MSIKKMTFFKKNVSLIFFALFFCFNSHASSSHQHFDENTPTEAELSIDSTSDENLDLSEKINFQSEVLYRNLDSDKIQAEKNVVVKYKDMTIYADDIEFYADSKIGKSNGKIKIEDSKDEIHGSSLDYDFENEKGIIKNAKTFYAPWVMRGKELERQGVKKAIFRRGAITSCDYECPHFYFKASKIIVYTEDKLVAYNVFIFVKGIPIFYFPIFYQSLKDQKMEITISIGQNSIDGWYENLRVKYPLSRDQTITAYIDNYDNRGLGLGLKYDYKKPDVLNGSIYGYGIDDRIDESMKRTLRIDHTQKITKNLRSFVKINYQNDEGFDRDFTYTGDPSSSNPGERLKSNIYSYSSLNYFKEFYSMMLLWEREENWDNTKLKYLRSREYLPSFSFDTNRNKFFVNGLFYKLGFNFVDNYSTINENYYLSGNSYFNLTTSQKLTRNITLTPTVGLRKPLENKLDEFNVYHEISQTKIDTNLNLRNRITRDIDLNLSYYYTTDIEGSVKNVDTKKLNIDINTYFLRGALKVRAYSGYDFNLKTNNTVDRFSPITTEVRARFGKYFNSYTRTQYNLQQEKNDFFQNILYFFPSPRISFSENVSYLPHEPGKVDAITTIKFRPNFKWRMDYSFRVDYDYTRNDVLKQKEREFAIYRDLHCWEMKFSVFDKYDATSKLYREFWISFSLKALPDKKIALYRDNRFYDEWYYWDIKSQT